VKQAKNAVLPLQTRPAAVKMVKVIFNLQLKHKKCFSKLY